MSGGLALAAALLAAALPEGRARWRFELSGEHVGVVELAVRCGGERCAVAWTSERRAPADAGGRRTTRRVELDVDRDGAWRGGRIRVVDDAGDLAVAGYAGAVPSVLAEVVLAKASPTPRPGAETCLAAFDEVSGLRGTACGRREGDAVAVTVLGVAEEVAPGAGGFPARIEIPSQRARFVRDDEATAPHEAPRLYGVAVAGPDDASAARSFCGVARDPDPPAAGPGRLPPPRADGASCRDKTAAWLAAARRAGLTGRTAVGVAFDGARFAWHAWAEVRLERGWIAVDPTFEQLPARGPRFTVATSDDRDERARQRAGERVLACWGKAQVR